MVKRISRSTTEADPVAVEAEQLAAGHEVCQLGLADLELGAGSTSGPRAAELASAAMRLYAEWARVMLGRSDRELPAKDPRFSDPAWRDHPLYRRLGQGYLAFCDTAEALVDEGADWRKRERAKFLAGILTSTLALSRSARRCRRTASGHTNRKARSQVRVASKSSPFVVVGQLCSALLSSLPDRASGASSWALRAR